MLLFAMAHAGVRVALFLIQDMVVLGMQSAPLHRSRGKFAALVNQARDSLAFTSSSRSSHGSYRQEMHNLGDVQFTADISVGGQVLRGILDTGSFELLVLSSDCDVCGSPEHLYSRDMSDDYEEGDQVTEHSFGSGLTWSGEAFDTVSVGPFVSRRQHFWEVFDADMPILKESTFAAIVGVGPWDAAEQLAEEAEKEPPMQETIVKEDSTMVKAGLTHHRRSQPKRHSARHFPSNSSSTNSTNSTVFKVGASICSQFEVQTFSVCISKESGGPGYFIWNDKRPSQGHGYLQVPVVGDMHWAAEMRNVRMDGPMAETLGINSPLGCEDGCSAIIDSGTSLLAAPMGAIMAVDAALSMLNEDCSNLGDMPDLHFSLGGHNFTLPPDAYIGQIVDRGKPSMRDILHFKFRSSRSSCVPLFMNMDVASELGPMWILGLPFFRKYYTTFDFDTSTTPTQKRMSFIEADDDCEPSTSEESFKQSTSRRNMKPMKVNMDQLRVPSWVERAIHRKSIAI
jgi:hypothetical protein